MVKRHQGGFTLVELIFVIAISMALAVTVISTQSGVRAQATFRSATEDLASYLNQVRTAAQTHISANSTGGVHGLNDAQQVIFGELLTITPGSGALTVTDMIGSNAAGGNLAAGADVDTITYGDSTTHSLQGAATIKGIINSTTNTEFTTTGANYYVVYATSGNKVVTYDFGNVLPAKLVDLSNYASSPDSVPAGAARVDTVSIHLNGARNESGTVIIDGTKFGAVTTGTATP